MQRSREEEIHEAGRAVPEKDGRGYGLGCIGRSLGGLGARTDVHADHRARLFAGGEERVPGTRVQARQVEVGRELAESHCPDTPRRVASNFGRGQIGIPERDQTEWDQPAVTVATPLLDHPVVVGLHAQLGEVPVLPPKELLSAEAGVIRKAQLSLDPVGVHVLEAFLHAVAAGPHLVVANPTELNLVTWEASCGNGALQRGLVIFVTPPRDLRPLGAGRLDIPAADELRDARREKFDARADLPIAGGQATAPDVVGLDDMRIHVHDGWDRRAVLQCVERHRRLSLKYKIYD